MNHNEDKIYINEAQLVLAEKRTSLAKLRTGIAVFALPLSITSFLIATSRYYSFLKVISFLIPLGIACLSLAILGIYLIVIAVIKLNQQNKYINKLKKKNKILGEYID
ncbi:MAG: hypothetical protein CSA18_02350 [Deltaproteobacteria bacterium]|nr:MAG: hypothetical protein CSB21_01115 [Deltaproteobacteria bacterium]PIE74972.1 MAG: hypothetical protein CSA18_02350 [Deltaproteobacteria bacterium]